MLWEHRSVTSQCEIEPKAYEKTLPQLFGKLFKKYYQIYKWDSFGTILQGKFHTKNCLPENTMTKGC